LAISEILNQIPTHTLVDIFNAGWEGYSDVLISVDSMSNKDYFSLFMNFRESLTLAMLRSGLNTLCWQNEERVDQVGQLECDVIRQINFFETIWA
jgi:hypothetical protein